MSSKALFPGLIVDERDQPVRTGMVGQEAVYVVDDSGFNRHIACEEVDRQILRIMADQIRGSEAELSGQAARMLGSDDIFSKALIENQLKNIEQQFDLLVSTGIPEETRAFLGMAGFKVVIDMHGRVLRLEQPAADDPEENRGE